MLQLLQHQNNNETLVFRREDGDSMGFFKRKLRYWERSLQLEVSNMGMQDQDGRDISNLDEFSYTFIPS